MPHPVKDIEGIGKVYNRKLLKAEIRTTNDLLRSCAKRSGRRDLAQQTGFSEQTLLRWANFADLMRVSGVGEHYSELLEAAGVDTVTELAHRSPSNLCQKIQQTNKKKRLVRRPPSEKQIHRWIQHAKRLKRKLHH